MRYVIGARRVDGHAIGDRRSPGGIGAGIEIAHEIEADQASRPIRRRRARVICEGWRLVVAISDSGRV